MEVDDLTESLRARGFSVEALHGGLDQPTRDRVMKRARSGQIDAIVATDVAARGIDLENLTHVINFGIPASYETYVHRIGRTGRAAAPAPPSPFSSRASIVTCAPSRASRRPASKCAPCRPPRTCAPAVSK